MTDIDLEPYMLVSGTPCRKCGGSPLWNVRFRPHLEVFYPLSLPGLALFGPRVIPMKRIEPIEHLEITCSICGYVRRMQTRDA